MEIIDRYFPDLTVKQRNQYLNLRELYLDWNQKVNVISRKDIEQLYLRHVLHSMAIGKYVRFTEGTKILDAGTGGGFPGVPLAILFPETEFLLVDSIGKKIKVVNAICNAVGLKNCKAQQTRAEQVKGHFDFIVSRAVTSLPVFISWIHKLIIKQNKNSVTNGILALKGGDLTEELRLPYNTRIINLTDYFEEAFFETKKLIHVML